MQCLADITGIEVHVSAVRETTSLGVAFLAGLEAAFWQDLAELAALWRASALYTPGPDAGYASLYPRWRQAVERARNWASAGEEA